MAEVVAPTPFAELSYWARRPDAPVIAVPLGLWNLRQPDTIRPRWSPAPADEGAIDRPLPACVGQLDLDSVAVNTAEGLLAVEAVYAGGPGRSRELRLHHYRAGESPVFAPEQHLARHETLTLSGCTVRLAHIDERHGPFDAIVPARSGGATLPPALQCRGPPRPGLVPGGAFGPSRRGVSRGHASVR